MRPLVPGELVSRISWLLFACALVFSPSAAAQQAGLTVTSEPALYPAFDPAVTDYVTRCVAGTPIDVSISSADGSTVAVDGQGARTGDFTARVSLIPGQAFRIIEVAGSSSQTYYVRCIPSDFPGWNFERSGQPQAEWYAVAPFARTNFQPLPPGVSPNYLALFDGNGVPVWWQQANHQPLDFHPLSNGNVVWTHFNVQSSEEHGLNGALVRTLTAVGSDIGSDEHEALLLPNGNYLLIVERVVPGFSFCGLVDQAILDYGFQEISPAGTVVSQWFASDDIPMSEVPPAWCSTIQETAVNGVYDVYHENSLELDGSDVLISFRHLDAVYSVNAVGAINWKLGGTSRPESLTALNDPLAATDVFRGQHDARVLPDGTVTVFDNGFHPGDSRAPRAVRYAIDEDARTADLVEQKNDADPIGTPLCCGSARKLSGGDWLMSWGNAGLITELSPSGSRVFRLTFADSLFSYRAHAVPFGTLSRDALREGMDAQVPRGFVRPRGTPRMKMPLVPASRECISPDIVHGEPLAFGSCSSPQGASDHLTVGTPDANGAPANSIGSVGYRVQNGDPSTPVTESDVRMTVQLTDVRRKVDLFDYTGELQMRPAVRITDRLNGSLQNEGGTGLDTEFPAAVPCTATESATTGGVCSLSTTFNALMPGIVVDGKRANWELGQIRVFDGGDSEVAGGSGASLFAVQGLFVP